MDTRAQVLVGASVPLSVYPGMELALHTLVPIALPPKELVLPLCVSP